MNRLVIEKVEAAALVLVLVAVLVGFIALTVWVFWS